MKFIRLFKKNISLRIVNFLGLAIMFACVLLSVSYIKRELSYDRHYAKAESIMRLTMQYDDAAVDGRIWGNDLLNQISQMPEIERIVKMVKLETSMLSYEEKKIIVKDTYAVSSDFLELFDLHLLQGEKEDALQRTGQALISESFARQLFGNIENDEFQKSAIYIEGQRSSDTVFVSGIFKDMPETSHFTTDILFFLPEEYNGLFYTYLLLKDNTDVDILTQNLNDIIDKSEEYTTNVHFRMTPLTDIHLHSYNLREMSVNGNINYLYLVLGANLLLLLVVMFNLWLNAGLIFAHNRRYYQMLRLYGTSHNQVFIDETLSALLLGFISMGVGIIAAFNIVPSEYFQLSLFEIVTLCLLFMVMIILVSLIPALKNISLTQFLNTNNDIKPVRFSYSNVKYMLIAQYAVVMLVVIIAFGINKQMNLVKEMQVGGNEQGIMVLQNVPDPVKEKYDVLQLELLKHNEIKEVTACFQLPGEAIRDQALVKKEEETEGEWLPLMVVGEDFIPFFQIPLVAGKAFSQRKFDFQTELDMMYDLWKTQKSSEYVEEYIINRKALTILGFNTPEDALGKILHLEQGGLDYINQGIIVGVTSDFNYTGLYEETDPLIMMQRNLYLHNIMVRLDEKNMLQARHVFETVWHDVFPDYPVDYMFMNDVLQRKYHNEMNAQYLIFIFSLLCLIIADLGLIIVMAFIIKRRTKEIGLRKVHGASMNEIVRMLNMGFIRYIALAFLIAIPVAWYIMHRWLERFAYQTELSWWIFGLAGFSVLFVSVLSVSLQSWRAAATNPVKAIKME